MKKPGKSTAAATVLGIVAVAVVLGVLLTGRAAPADEPVAAASARAPAASVPHTESRAPYNDEAVRRRQEQRVIWKDRLVRAQDTLESYKASTRYPPEARPIAEHSDQQRPFDPVAESMPLRSPGGEPVKGVRIRTTQDRIFAGGSETVSFTVRAVDDNGAPLPLLATRASAFDLPDPRQVIGRPQAVVSFIDSGSPDHVLSATLQPATAGFADFAGTIRTQVYLNQNGQLGNVYFDVVYNPQIPAEWAGVREALEAGSLNFYLKAKITQAGRYVISARVDDATGKPFALLNFNDEMPAGMQEFRLPLFGKLVRDGKPGFPLSLRDVQGFLLLPDRYPDRSMMARQAGIIHTSQTYALASFSDAEWRSEERDRYLTELSKDVNEAQQQVDALTP